MEADTNDYGEWVCEERGERFISRRRNRLSTKCLKFISLSRNFPALVERGIQANAAYFVGFCVTIIFSVISHLRALSISALYLSKAVLLFLPQNSGGTVEFSAPTEDVYSFFCRGFYYAIFETNIYTERIKQ